MNTNMDNRMRKSAAADMSTVIRMSMAVDADVATIMAAEM